MKNRFRFRAWHNPTKKMFEVHCFVDKEVFENTIDGVGASPTNPANIDDCVLMQSTGKKDVKGNLIYEGDIVTWVRPFKDHDVQNVCQIVFDENHATFGPMLGDFHCQMPQQSELYMHLMGNIYENPELLEDK